MSITVLMTTYDCGKYISQAIQSVLNQTYKDFELLIIDDGSTDGTEKVVNSFSDERIRFIQSKHIGRSKALNFGLARCNSNFICIVDSDDFAHPYKLEIQYKFLLENQDIDIVGSWANLINERGELIGILTKPLNKYIIKKNILTMNGISFGTSLIRYSNIHFKYFNENLTFGEDLEWLYKNSFYSSYRNLQEKLMNLRQKDDSLSRTKRNDYKELSAPIGAFINLELKESRSYKSKKLLIRDLGLVEYYYGNTAKSFRYFFKVCVMNPFDITNLRYLISGVIISLFGESIRNKKISRIFSNLYRNLDIKLSHYKKNNL